MPIWQVKEDPADPGQVKVFNESGSPTQTLKTVTPGIDPLWGPSLASEIIASGITDTINWSPTVLEFNDQAIQPGQERNTLYAVLTAHDPTAPKPVDSWQVALEQFEVDATALLEQPSFTEAEARPIMQALLDAWP